MEDKKLDVMFTKVKRKPSQKQIEANRKNGKIGGQKSKRVMTEEEKKAFSRIGVEARKKKLNDLKGKDYVK